MRLHHFTFCLLLLLSSLAVFAQDEDRLIHTKDGGVIGYKRALIIQCRKSYGAAPDNQLVMKICECEVNLLDQRYTQKQIKAYDKKYKENWLSMLMREDTLLQTQLKECSAGSEHILMLSLPGYRKSFIDKCVENLRARTKERIDETQAISFCNCAATVMENRKITVNRFDELADPSSFVYNEIAYRCGSPYLKPSDFAPGWKAADSTDVIGPISIDTVSTVLVMGMHKIKITIGGITKIWLLDSGASDLLISEEYAKELKSKGVITDQNYLGEGSYSLADSRIITCKRYKINGVKIGRFQLNNVVLSVSKDAREFLLGKVLLNKFSQWTLDNKADVLILKK